VIDQALAHQSARDREEMVAVFQSQAVYVDEPQADLVYERRGVAVTWSV
jgi:hypothetical protein